MHGDGPAAHHGADGKTVTLPAPKITSSSGKTATFKGWWTQDENNNWGERLAAENPTIGEANVTYYAR